MALERLEVHDFRCIGEAHLEPDSRATLICGENGSGKTSLLEAIYVLGAGRSFRAPRLDQLVRNGTESFTSVGHVTADLQRFVLGLKAGKSTHEARLNGSAVRTLSELASAFPVQVIEPGLHKLLEEGPSRRRRLLDWGVFHVEHTFRTAWARYQRALKQRSAALKQGQSESSTRLWDAELCASGEVIAQFREKYVGELGTFFQQLSDELLELPAEIQHAKGWRTGLSLEQALDEAWPRDRVLKVTSVGPHRADVAIKLNGVLAKDRVSRGQQKLLAAALILAQQRHRVSMGAAPACLLVDDPAAELDVDNLGKLMGAIAKTSLQLIATGLSDSALGQFELGRVFHVKQGVVTRML